MYAESNLPLPVWCWIMVVAGAGLDMPVLSWTIQRRSGDLPRMPINSQHWLLPITISFTCKLHEHYTIAGYGLQLDIVWPSPLDPGNPSCSSDAQTSSVSLSILVSLECSQSSHRMVNFRSSKEWVLTLQMWNSLPKKWDHSNRVNSFQNSLHPFCSRIHSLPCFYTALPPQNCSLGLIYTWSPHIRVTIQVPNWVERAVGMKHSKNSKPEMLVRPGRDWNL